MRRHASAAGVVQSPSGNTFRLAVVVVACGSAEARRDSLGAWRQCLRAKRRAHAFLVQSLAEALAPTRLTGAA